MSEPAVMPVFELELLKMIRDGIHEQNKLMRELLGLVRDFRDELAIARERNHRGNGAAEKAVAP